MSTTLDHHRQAFEQSPEDPRAFDALEEQLFLAGEWSELVTLYERRCATQSLQNDAPARAALLFRMAQVLEERCLDSDAALARYWEVARLEPGSRPALRQARQIHTAREQWDMVLQIAEIEAQAPMQPWESAVFHAEMGGIWLEHLSDAEQALGCFGRALEADASQQDAMAGQARCLQELGRHAEAAASWESLVEVLRGPDRSPALVSLAALLAGPLEEPERAIEFYQRALGDDPRNAGAVDALVQLATDTQQWPLLADLYDLRFDLAAGARTRTTIALEAGRLSLERLEQPQAARLWFQRALELCPEDASVHSAMADLERHAGNRPALLASLDRVIEISGDAVPAEVLLEAADLHAENGADATALSYLRAAHGRAPKHPQILGSLSESLRRAGRAPELAEILEQRSTLEGDSAEERAATLAELGRLQEEELGDRDAARDAYARAFELVPTQPGVADSLEQLLQKNESWAELRRLLEHSTRQGSDEERARRNCALGELLVERFEDPEGASAAFESAVELEAGTESASRGITERALRGIERLAVESGDEDAVIRAYEREAEVTSDRARLGFLVMELQERHEAAGRPEEALRWVERWVQTQPEDRSALENAARLYEQLGHRDSLRSLLERLETLLSGPEQAKERRRLAALHAEQGQSEEAIRWYKGALESEPEDSASLSALVSLYREADRLEDQVRVQRRLAEQLPTDEQSACLAEIAVLLEERLGDVDAAVVVLWRLLELPERPADTSLRLERLLERAGRCEELAQLWSDRRRSLADDSDEAVALDLRRAQLALEGLGQAEEAGRLFRIIRERWPDSEEASQGLEASLRATNDPSELARFLAERAEVERDPVRRAEQQLECAVLFEEANDEAERARRLYTQLADATEASDGDPAEPKIAEIAGKSRARLEDLLERSGEWGELRTRLEARLPGLDAGNALPLRERLAHLCRDRLGDAEGCVVHLEAAVAIAPERGDLWRGLGLLYQKAERTDDFRSAIEAELASEPGPERERVLRLQAARLCCESDRNEEARGHYEKVLEAEPGHTEACEFLIAHYEQSGSPEDVVRLLMARLDAAADDEGSRRTVLRLRIAALRADPLDDLDAAITILEPGLSEVDYAALVAEPLADLYQRAGRLAGLAALCQRAAEATHEEAERAGWQLRLGDTLRERDEAGDRESAVRAYRAVLEIHPDHQDARTALRDLHRRLGDAEPLADLLIFELDRPGRAEDERRPLRMELAELLGEALGRPDEALEQLLIVLRDDPRNEGAFERALDLAERLERPQQVLDLVQERLARSPDASARAALLERQADLLAGPLERFDEAPAAYREVLSLEPERSSARRSLRRVLERLERWPAVLDCLYVEARAAAPGERAPLLEQAVAIARDKISTDATLPWLERLRSERPDDDAVIEQIAGVHRMAGRPEALLRALEQQLERIDDLERQRELHLERGRILERDLGSPGRALAALEAAETLDPRHPVVLAELDRLYDLCARPRRRVEVIEKRLENEHSEQERFELQRVAARLYARDLAQAELAVPHLLRATEVCPPGSGARSEVLKELGEALRASGRIDLWARAAEDELRSLGSAGAARRSELHEALALAYERELARPEAAIAHARPLLDAESENLGPQPGDRLEKAEAILLSQLRADRDVVELARRLAARLERDGRDAGEWLELARLREESLHALGPARDAYREVLEREPAHPSALRGVRATSERLGDFQGLARAIEVELQGTRVNRERALLLRRLGEVCWQRLGDAPRADQALTEALEADEADLASLRMLQRVRESTASFPELLPLYEREVELLAGEETQRRQEVWFRIGEISRDQTQEPNRALAAFEGAAELGDLTPERLREWANLYERCERPERFVEIFAQWCDHSDSGATGEHHRSLAEALEELDRVEDARERALEATRSDPGSAGGWEILARLQERCEEPLEAARALERAGALLPGEEGLDRWLQAVLLLEESDTQQARELLRRCVERDAGRAEAWCHLARVASQAEDWEEAERAAGQALDSRGASALDASLRFDTSLSGGRAARARGKGEAAARFYGVATTLDAEHADALAGHAEVLFELGDLDAAQPLLERRLERPIADGDTGSAERAMHLRMLGEALEAAEEMEEALARFEAALEVDSGCQEAHAGAVRRLREAERGDEAVAALERWAEAIDEGPGRAECWRQAAALEQDRGDRPAAERLLRRSLEAEADAGEAWLTLAEILWAEERGDDALDAARSGLEAELDAPSRARLWRVAAAALEGRNEADEAARAYAEAFEADPRDDASALSAGRLLRATGQWREAAEVLQRFADRHPDLDHESLATVYDELGRLMSGPLEDMPAALRCYERAVALQPALTRAREPLARLLTHLPDREADAVRHHRALLEEDPLRAGSLRDLLTLAERAKQPSALETGRALVRALGIATPAERELTPRALPWKSRTEARIEPEIFEKLRRAACEAGRELDAALGTDLSADASAGSASFQEALRSAEAELSARCLVGLDPEALAKALGTLARVVLEPDAVRRDGSAAELDRHLGRWTRRKVRRCLEGLALRDLDQIDFGAWQAALRGVAAQIALERSGGDLRGALLTLSCEGAEENPASLDDHSDLSPLLRDSEAARQLLAGVIRSWCNELAQGI